MGEDNNKEYEFVTETIKKKPINKKKTASKILASIMLGILAGFVACVIFAVFAPKIYERMHPEDEPSLISIPEDEQDEYVETDEDDIEADIEESSTDDDQINVDEITDNEKEDIEITAEEETVSEGEETVKEVALEDITTEEDSSEENDIEEDDSTKKIVIEKQPLTLEDYKTFYSELSIVANEAKRSIVEVKGVTDSTDWFNNSYELGNVTTGLIVADNGKELLIITNSAKLKNAKGIEVTFCDDRTYSGTVKKCDASTDLVVVAVTLDDIEEITKNSYATAQLGNSMMPTIVGTPVIAIGSPLGIEDSMVVGTVTSNTRVLEHTDNNVRYLTTDIYGSTEGSGVLVNLEGRVLGIIFQGGTSTDTKNLVHAYSISDIKSKIEKLSNGQDMAYLGIIGTDVTVEAMDALGVPQGTYVKQVVVDSPAMKGGIHNGDVIVKVGTSDIYSFKDFKVALNKCQPGDIAMVTVKRLGKDGYVEFSYEIYLEALK